MYGFSEDEQHLLFMDCFGLTRLSRPKAVKTDAKISGSESAGLVTVSADGSAAGSYEDLWDKSVLWAFPELKSSRRFDRFREKHLMVHPDGQHYVIAEHGPITIKPMGKTVLLPLRLDAPKPSKKPSKEVTLTLEGGKSLPDLKLDLKLGEAGRPNVPVRLRLGHDGSLLHYDGTSLIHATLDGTQATVNWRRKLIAPDGVRVDIHADASRCVLAMHQGRRWLIVHTKDGKDVRFEVESLAVPAVAGRFLVHQSDPTTLVRTDLDSGETTDISLELTAKQRKLELDNAGPGTIFAGPKGALLFLPKHRESILDLNKNVEVPRKLPAKELEIRQALLANARPYLEAARLAGVGIELGRAEFNPKYNSVSVTHRIAGPEGLFGALLAGYSQSAWSNVTLPGSWRMGSYGSHGGISAGDALNVKTLVEGYAALSECGVPFASTIGFWANDLSRGRNDSELATDVAAVLAQALVTVVRDGGKAKLDFAALAKRGAPSVDEVLAAMQHYPSRTQELDYGTTRLMGALFNQLYGADAARIWRFIYLEATWDGYGTHHGDFDYYAIRPLLEAHPKTAEVFRAWLSEAGDIPDDRRWHVDQLRTLVG